MPRAKSTVTLALMLSLLLLSACDAPLPSDPTATPTRTPIIPTATPTATATATPTATPTPTLPPGLVLPYAPVPPTGWPALPAHLYFLREAHLMRWPSGGGNLEQIIPNRSEATETVLRYIIGPQERFIVYANAEGKLRRLDMASGEIVTLPTAGLMRDEAPAAFALTPDGRWLAYIAWGVNPNADPGLVSAQPDFTSGAIFALDLEQPQNLQIALGFCQSHATARLNRPCSGILLSPDGAQLAYAEKQGLWISQLTTGESRLVAVYSDERQSIWELLGWSSGGGWLLAERRDFEGSLYAVISTATGEVQELPNTACYAGCSVEAAWGRDGVWVAITYERTGNGELYLAIPAVGQPLFIAREFGGQDTAFITPYDPQELSDGRLAFVHRGCVSCPHPEGGLYTLNPDDTWTPVALIPNASGATLWTANASAFIYRERGRGWDDSARQAWPPVELSLSDGSRRWDVRAQLENAEQLQWAQP